VTLEEKRKYNRQYCLDNKPRLKQQNKEYREAHRERLLKARKKRYAENKQEIKEKQMAYRKTTSAKELRRKRQLGKNGWTQEMYEVKFEEQTGLCEICKIPTAPRAQGGFLVCDHEHCEPPKPRGLLCTRCNTGLGQFLDNPLLLIEAAIYLAKHAFARRVQNA
jgi:hypothetical protein